MDYPRTVYMIRHNKTKRVYIGSSKRPEQRYKSHIEALRGGRHPVEDMQADFDKYGEDYTVEILEVITKFEDRSHEYDWMEKYNSVTRGIGYNYKDFANRKRERPISNRGRLIKLINSLTDAEAEMFLNFLNSKAVQHERNLHK